MVSRSESFSFISPSENGVLLTPHFAGRRQTQLPGRQGAWRFPALDQGPAPSGLTAQVGAPKVTTK